MQNLKCVIIDDEPNAVRLIKEHCLKAKSLNVTAEFTDSSKAFMFLTQNMVDLIFIDIDMPGINGLDFIKNLTIKPKVIITTAYREFAFEGFENDVVDYLLKPITYDRFLRAVAKIPVSLTTDTNYQNIAEVVLLKEGKKTHRIKIKDIVFLEGMSEFVKVNLIDKNIVIKTSLCSVLNSLPSNSFLRIHKSYVVAIDKIDLFSRTKISIGKTELPIGRSFKEEVFNILSK